MAEIKNTPPIGLKATDADVSEPIVSSAIRKIVGDIANLRDIVSGEDATNYLDHSGEGRGARIGLPLCHGVWPDGGRSGNGYNTDGGGLDTGKSKVLWAVPVKVPRGVTSIYVDGGFKVQEGGIDVFQSAATTFDPDAAADPVTPESNGLYKLDVTADTVVIVYARTRDEKRASTEVVGPSFRARYVHPTIYPMLPRGVSPAIINPPQAFGTFTLNTDTVDGQTVPDLTVFEEQSTNADTATIVDGMVSDNHAFSAHIAQQINRNLNAIGEHLLGSPASGGDALTLSDDTLGMYNSGGHSFGGTRYGGRAIDVPMFAKAFGAIPPVRVRDDVAGGYRGIDPVAPRIINGSSALVTADEIRFRMPLVTSGRLRAAVAVKNYDTSPRTVTALVTLAGGRTGTAATVVPAGHVGLISFPVTTGGVELPGNPDVATLDVSQGGGKNGDIAVAGWCLYVEGE